MVAVYKFSITSVDHVLHCFYSACTIQLAKHCIFSSVIPIPLPKLNSIISKLWFINSCESHIGYGCNKYKLHSSLQVLVYIILSVISFEERWYFIFISHSYQNNPNHQLLSRIQYIRSDATRTAVHRVFLSEFCHSIWASLLLAYLSCDVAHNG